jgi:hypothetical protein
VDAFVVVVAVADVAVIAFVVVTAFEVLTLEVLTLAVVVVVAPVVAPVVSVVVVVVVVVVVAAVAAADKSFCPVSLIHVVGNADKARLYFNTYTKIACRNDHGFIVLVSSIITKRNKSINVKRGSCFKIDIRTPAFVWLESPSSTCAPLATLAFSSAWPRHCCPHTQLQAMRRRGQNRIDDDVMRRAVVNARCECKLGLESR